MKRMIFSLALLAALAGMAACENRSSANEEDFTWEQVEGVVRITGYTGTLRIYRFLLG